MRRSNLQNGMANAHHVSEWGTLSEYKVNVPNHHESKSNGQTKSHDQSLVDVLEKMVVVKSQKTGIREVDRVLGGGSITRINDIAWR